MTNAVFPDAFVETHFQGWLAQYVARDDQARVTRQIRALVDDIGFDHFMARAYSWPQLRAMAERS